MTPQPDPGELKRWHRHFGVACNNQAFASAWHWSKVGTALNGARADVTIAHAAAVLGDGGLHANHYALARQLGAAIAEDEDRQVFEAELARIPNKVNLP